MGEKTFLWSELETCDFSVKTVVTSDVVLYHNQSPMNCILHFAELRIGCLIRYKYTLDENIFLKYKIKIIIISFNCFEYIFQ